jgi:hypothetical protein
LGTEIHKHAFQKGILKNIKKWTPSKRKNVEKVTSKGGGTFSVWGPFWRLFGGMAPSWDPGPQKGRNLTQKRPTLIHEMEIHVLAPQQKYGHSVLSPAWTWQVFDGQCTRNSQVSAKKRRAFRPVDHVDLVGWLQALYQDTPHDFNTLPKKRRAFRPADYLDLVERLQALCRDVSPDFRKTTTTRSSAYW